MAKSLLKHCIFFTPDDTNQIVSEGFSYTFDSGFRHWKSETTEFVGYWTGLTMLSLPRFLAVTKTKVLA